MGEPSFLSSSEEQLSDEFLASGFIIRPVHSPALLDQLRSSITEETNKYLTEKRSRTPIRNLHESHLSIDQSFVNDIRLHLFAFINQIQGIRNSYLKLAEALIDTLVGNELAMQNKINLSIQQPGDQTSVLELHSDVWSGDSPFQLVQWIPLTDSLGTNAMFFLPPEKSIEALGRARNNELRSMAEIQSAYQKDFLTIEVRYGEVLIFDSNCLHGNQLNSTAQSRWSLNCRVVGLFAPATTPERRLGPYYTPIKVRAATRVGMRALSALGLLS